MKLFKSFLAAFLLLATAQAAFAQAPEAASQTKGTTKQLQMKTSAMCERCKAHLEKAMATEQGVQHANLNVATKMLTLTYQPGKTTPEALRAAVQHAGYTADEQPASCCEKGAGAHPKGKH